MKGTIIRCLQDLVVEKFGKDRWDEICSRAGFPSNSIISLSADIDDATAIELIANTGSVLGLTPQQAADAFGDYWVNEYANDVYKSTYRRFNSAREFILGMDEVHVSVTQSISNAKPPRFAYEWQGDRTLIVTYKSRRGLVDIFVGLARGLGRYYGEDLSVTKLGTNRVQILFPEA